MNDNQMRIILRLLRHLEMSHLKKKIALVMIRRFSNNLELQYQICSALKLKGQFNNLIKLRKRAGLQSITLC